MINQEDKTMTKKFYNQPEVQIASIRLSATVLTVSTTGGTGAGKLNSGVETDDQW